MIDKKLHDYLEKVLQTFLIIANDIDGQYFNNIPPEKFNIVYCNQDVYESRKGRKLLLNNKNHTKKLLYAPFEYTFYVIDSLNLRGDNPHPEAPKLYLDAFLIDNSLEENQRVYLLLGNETSNTVTIRTYDRFPDGRIMGVSSCIPMTDWQDSEQTLISLADVLISSFCAVNSKCKFKKVKSALNLHEVVI